MLLIFIGWELQNAICVKVKQSPSKLIKDWLNLTDLWFLKTWSLIFPNRINYLKLMFSQIYVNFMSSMYNYIDI